MGVDLYGFVSCLNGVVAQRLVRLNCSHCADADDSERVRVLALRGGTERALTLKRGKGCNHCHGTGYRGRTAVAEVLTIDDRLRDLIAQRAPIETIKQHVYGAGRRGLGDAALDLVCAGRTTFDEVQRVVDLA
jgi:general secretion pathway protein E